jgi:hypothetical protein
MKLALAMLVSWDDPDSELDKGLARVEWRSVKVANTGVYAASPVRVFCRDFAVLWHGQTS